MCDKMKGKDDTLSIDFALRLIEWDEWDKGLYLSL